MFDEVNFDKEIVFPENQTDNPYEAQTIAPTNGMQNKQKQMT